MGFFDDKSSTFIETDIENVSNFSRLNPNITLDNLPKYEDLHEREIQPNINFNSKITPFNEAVEDREFKQKEDGSKELAKIRLKIFLVFFTLISLVLTGFVVYNLIESILLNNKVKDNAKTISNMNRLVEEKQQSMRISIELPEDLRI